MITVYGDTDSWKQRMGFQSQNAAYLVLIDRHGIIRWRHSGGFDEEGYKELSAQMARLLQEAT